MLWEFPSSLAFSRMNSFFHRVQTIEVKLKFHSFLPPNPSEEVPRAGLRAERLSSMHGISYLWISSPEGKDSTIVS